MPTSRQEEDELRLATLRNDQRVREQGSTMFDHARAALDDEAGGRYARTTPATVVGSQPFVRYPQLPSGPWSGSDPVGQEPPLGHRVDQMPGLEPPAVSSPWPAVAAQAGAPASDDPSPSPVDDVEHDAGAPFSNTGEA
jgi:hypothetical protein